MTMRAVTHLDSRRSALLLATLALLAACGGGGAGPPPAVSVPTLSGVSPQAGPIAGGTSVTLTGTGFVAGATVSFGGVAGTVTALSATSITATTPARPAGAADVRVVNPDGGSVTLTGIFTFQPPVVGTPPVLTAINVRGGPVAGGTQVLATGSGFVAGLTVTVGGSPGTGVSLLNATTVRFFTPPQPEGRYDVVVTNPDLQSSTLVNAFHYGPAPVVTQTLCSNGCGAVRPGDTLTFNGANFATGPGEGVSVQFTSTDTGQAAGAAAQSATPTQIVVLAPTLDGAGRQYRVSISNFDGQTAVVPTVLIYQ